MAEAGGFSRTDLDRPFPLSLRTARFLPPLLIFVGAFLLFAVEPLAGKMILPWFGGSAEVWTTCLLFFQVALVCGYLYAHLLARYLSPSRQARVHTALLLASCVSLPIFPSPYWQPAGGQDPLLLILALLTQTVGAPFILLAATGPLVQSWLARERPMSLPKTSPYRLFALSNFGSMAALLSYPVLVEPNLPIRPQVWIWSAGYGLFVLLSAAAAWRYGKLKQASTETRAEPGEVAPPFGDRVACFLLAMAASAMLLAVTNHVLQNIAAIPLFWVLPLSLYLLSFIISFGRSGWYLRPVWYALCALATAAMMYGLEDDSVVEDLPQLLALFMAGLFICCIVCNGELEALRPPARFLTSYYLIIAIGGAAGGVLVAVVAPLVLNGAYDLPIVLPATALLVFAVACRRNPPWHGSKLRFVLAAGTLSTLAVVTYRLASAKYDDLGGNLFLGRNFYGALHIWEDDDADAPGALRHLANGSIVHGTEFLAADKQREPTSYYARATGVGLLFQELGKGGPLKAGVIGLGAGTIAAYGREGDTFRFYDINPLVETIATRYFWYLQLCPADWTIALGDARLSLQKEVPQQFDILVVDAFTSDSIPVHLLTKEAIALYWRHLKPDGVLAVHISNRYVNLGPVVALAAVESGKTAKLISTDEDDVTKADGADWMLVTSREGFFSQPAFEAASTVDIPPGFRAWTDEYSNLWKSLL